MQTQFVPLLVGFALLAFSCGAFAGAADLVTVNEPHARAVPPGQSVSAAFMELANTSAADHALVAAESPAAETVELHEHTMRDGMMAMREIPRIDLPAGQSVSLQPGGLHVMLIGLKQPLNAGDRVEITLVFEDGSRQTIEAPVRKAGVMMKHHHH